MAQARWATPALPDLTAILQWLDENAPPTMAARVAAEITEAAQWSAQHPEASAWVGSVYPQLADVPRSVRRVLTRSRRHVIYYRYRAGLEQVEILCIRGAGQLPPTPDEIAG